LHRERAEVFLDGVELRFLRNIQRKRKSHGQRSSIMKMCDGPHLCCMVIRSTPTYADRVRQAVTYFSRNAVETIGEEGQSGQEFLWGTFSTCQKSQADSRRGIRRRGLMAR